MHILVVDDSEDGRDVTEAMLGAAGYDNIDCKVSAAETFAFLKIGGAATQETTPVDLVLLDIMMPDMDGIETCAHIRSDPRYADVPIIMLTMLADMDSLANAFVAGATDYITKPVKRVELLARVRSALKLKAELDRRKAREIELLALHRPTGNIGDPSRWIDKATCLPSGEVAEAYLASLPQEESATSVLALMVDRLEAYRATQGEKVACKILQQVAGAVRGVAATAGTLVAAYRSGVIVLVVPAFSAKRVQALAEALSASVVNLAISNGESIAADHVTASVAVVSGHVRRADARVELLAQAISQVQGAAARGGNRIVPIKG
jgi:sigma-B regulation protein RsbU (phosphoserine phosphatase)